jgi:hypothetical protein
LPWDDPDRPAGSVFSSEEWEATRAGSGFARTIIFELHKGIECGLVTLDADRLDVVHTMFLDQALLVDETLGERHPAWHNATARLEHCGKEFGRWSYRVVHAEVARDRIPGLRAARLRTGDARAVEAADQGSAPAHRG